MEENKLVEDLIEDSISCLSNMPIEDTTYSIARDIVINELINAREIISKATKYNEHLIKDAKYHLNKGHLRKMKKILGGED